jgi:hypothetical protein
MSNYLGWFIQDHIDFMFGTTQNCGSSSSSSSDNAARDSVKVWASNDNVNWSEVEQFDAPPIIKGLGLGNWGFTLTLSTPQTNYRYYKISNAESDYLTISSNQINPGEIEVF